MNSQQYKKNNTTTECDSKSIVCKATLCLPYC